jgi:hypothetical protein
MDSKLHHTSSDELEKKYKDKKYKFCVLSITNQIAPTQIAPFTINVDRSIDFYSRELRAISTSTAGVATVYNYLITSIQLGDRTNLLFGSGIHSDLLSRDNNFRLPVHVPCFVAANSNITFMIQNLEAATTIQVYLYLIGESKPAI